MRAGSIAWISAFAPEAVGRNEKKRLNSIVHSINEKQDYESFYWYRTLWLDAACFLLHGNKNDIVMIIGNIDHHNSSLRSAVHPPLGLISTRVGLDDQDFNQRIRNCLEKRYFYNESLMCILSALKDDNEQKIDFVTKWRNEVDLNPQDVKVLKSIVEGGFISNSLISDEFSRIKRYLFCRLLDPELDKNVNESLMDSFGMDCQSIWNRMDNHPLWGSAIFFQYRKIEKFFEPPAFEFIRDGCRGGSKK